MTCTPTFRPTSAPAPPADPADWRAWVRYGLGWAEPARWQHLCSDGLDSLSDAEQRRIVDELRCPWTPAAPAVAPTADRVTPWSPAPSPARNLTFHAYREAVPGQRWQALFEATWPAYRAWYLADGDAARPGLDEARGRLERHMPELVPTWERLVELTCADETAARMLTMWRVPVYAAGCSQALLPGADPVLVRNYDYDASLFEGVLASTNYSGSRRVLGTSDMLWGLLDGMNEDGLTVSLTYGGRLGGGDGFAIPLVLRYLLETCTDVPAAIATLRRLPVAQAYNLALLDGRGGHATVFVAPGEEPVVSELRVSTNHRLETVENAAVAARLRTVPRQRALLDQLATPTSNAAVVASFTRAPLRTVDYDGGFGTLYTAEYHPVRGEVTYRWPDASWTRRFDDDDAARTVSLAS